MKNQLLFGAIAASIATFGFGTTQAQALDLTGKTPVGSSINCFYDGGDLDYCSGTTNGGLAIFTTNPDLGATGSGVFNPFLRVHDNPNGQGADGIQDGVNTDESGVLDNIGGVGEPHTHSAKLGDLSSEGGYRTFILDLGEPGSGSTDNSDIQLTDLRLYVGSASDDLINPFSPGAGQSTTDYLGSVLTNIFTLDQTVFLTDRSSGNGKADLIVKIANSFFDGASLDQHFYLYSKFEGFAGTFEEWSYRAADPDPDPVPSPAAVLPILGGLFGAASRRKKGESTEA